MSFSSLACAKAVVKLGGAASKTHLFLCFHKIQAPKKMTELSPLLAAPEMIALFLAHQSKKETSPGCGETSYKLTLPRKENQNCTRD
jgi:hypothetical protein